MTTKELIFFDDGLDLGKLPDLMSLGRRMIGLEVATQGNRITVGDLGRSVWPNVRECRPRILHTSQGW